MNNADHFYLSYDRQTGEPVGVFDAFGQPPRRGELFGPMIPSPTAIQIPFRTQPQIQRGPAVAVPAGNRVRAYGWLAAVVFGAGLFAGCLLFGGRSEHPPMVVVCQVPNSYPFAPESSTAPADCGPAQQIPAGSDTAVTR